MVLLPLGGGASSGGGGAFWARTDPAATIITHARIIVLISISLLVKITRAFSGENLFAAFLARQLDAMP
jgi:hypothetical protein